MKTKNYLLLIILLIILNCPTYGQWVILDSLNYAISNISTSGGKLFICTTTNGVYISTDSGYTMYASNNGLTNLNTRIIQTKDSLLVLGTNNAIYKSTDYGTTWILANNGLPLNLNSNVEDIMFKGDSILIATFGNGIYCSLNYCETWFPLNNGFSDLQRRCLFYNGNRLFAGTTNSGSGIYISDDNGSNWVPKNNGVPTMLLDPTKYVDITSFTMVGQTIFASTLGGDILSTENNGESWDILNCPNTYSWLMISSNNSLLTGHDGAGVCRSDDLGITWNYKNEGLDAYWYKDIRTFCTFGSYIYAGGYLGVYPGAYLGKILRRPISELITGMPTEKTRISTLVYPNPISNQSRIIVPTWHCDKYSLEIFNELGHCVKKLNGFDVNKLELRSKEFIPGLYFLRITTIGNESFLGKFIVD